MANDQFGKEGKGRFLGELRRELFGELLSRTLVLGMRFLACGSFVFSRRPVGPVICRFLGTELGYLRHPPGGDQRDHRYQEPAEKGCCRRSHKRDDHSGLRLAQRMKPAVA